MKARLLHRDRDFDPQQPLPWNAEALVKDLDLDTLLNAMARGDEFLLDVAKKGILAGFEKDLEVIRYRQGVLRECLREPAFVRELYALAVEVMDLAKKQYLGLLARYPDSVLRYSIDHVETFRGMLERLRRLIGMHAGKFASEGWASFFGRLEAELDDEYFAAIAHHLGQLKFRNGVLLSAQLGSGNRASRYTLHEPPPRMKVRWLARLRQWFSAVFHRKPPTAFAFSLDSRDESGIRALRELRDRGISLAANALAQSVDQVRSFFAALRAELAFYVGCLNLHEELARKGEPTCFPSPGEGGERRLTVRGLYDVCLALRIDRKAVGNDANADGKDLVVVTGANQGGKSTFLRSVGLAQLMMQCGMFAPAEEFAASVCDGLFTHYKREEDTGMKSGKLDEELSRMSEIVDRIRPDSLVLLNESFAATNEREGSEIAGQIISALLDSRIRVVCVTHLYELARGLYDAGMANALFLRAERQAGGARTFKLTQGEPLQTSFGEDLYREVFGLEAASGE